MELRSYGGDINRLRALAHELVGLQPDIILTGGTSAIVAVQRDALKQRNPHKVRVS
jgi:hypothetical protein